MPGAAVVIPLLVVGGVALAAASAPAEPELPVLDNYFELLDDDEVLALVAEFDRAEAGELEIPPTVVLAGVDPELVWEFAERNPDIAFYWADLEGLARALDRLERGPLSPGHWAFLAFPTQGTWAYDVEGEEIPFPVDAGEVQAVVDFARSGEAVEQYQLAD